VYKVEFAGKLIVYRWKKTLKLNEPSEINVPEEQWTMRHAREEWRVERDSGTKGKLRCERVTRVVSG